MTVTRKYKVICKCWTCGKEFEAKVYKSRYCSDACRQRAYRARRDIKRKRENNVTIYE